MPYYGGTDLVGIAACHADMCPTRDGLPCRCGLLGYRARIWDWDDDRWVESPLLDTADAARGWQRAANQAADAVPDGAVPDGDVDPAEKLFWWAFCYVGLGFVGVAVALFASDIAG
jgi:hypothetical protein